LEGPEVGHDDHDTASLLQKLGKHRGGIEQCLYINKFEDVDVGVLERIIRSGVKQTKKTERVTAN